MTDQLKQQIEFLMEIDKVKSIVRRTKLFDGSRCENDAEHSWHLAMMAIVLAEHANEPFDLVKVLKMILIHDIVEIDAGDFIVYTHQTVEKEATEKVAAERIFGMLPEGQKQELIDLWREFEERSTPEAKFAAALDRLEPVMQNYFAKGDVWVRNQIPAEQILTLNQERIGKGSDTLWEYAKSLIDECVDKGLIR